MGSILLWCGIVLIVVGWIALAWQASRRMAAKNKMEKFPEVRNLMKLRRNYCLITIFIGMLLLIISLLIK